MTIDAARRATRFSVAAMLAAAVVLVACDRSPSEPAYTGSPFDSLVVTLSSTLSVGRTVRPTLVVEHRTARSLYETTPEIDAATRFTSSDPAVLSVAADGAIHANAAGRATITARLADHQTNVVVDVIPGYTATLVDGTDGFIVAGVNDRGDVIGRTATGSNVLVRDGAVTDLAPCRPQAINNAGQIACIVPLPCQAPCYRVTPGLYSAGTLTTPFDTTRGEASGVSESGALFGHLRSPGAGSVFDLVFVWTAAGVTYRSAAGPDWEGHTYTVNSALNGLALYEGTLYPQTLLVRASSATHLLPAGGRWSNAVDINDADDAVGTAERLLGKMDVGGHAVVWRASRNWVPENPSYRAADATAISEAGQVVGSGEDGAYVWRDGRYTILTDALVDAGWTLTSAPSISRGGKVAAVGQHTSGKRGVVLIDLGAAP